MTKAEKAKRRAKADRDNAARRERRELRKLAGLCIRCETPLYEDSSSLLCPTHTAIATRDQQAWRKRLRKRPRKRARLAEGKRQGSERRKRRLIAKGLCYRCGGPDPEGPGLRCTPCREDHAYGMRIRSRTKGAYGRGFALLMESIERAMPGRLEDPINVAEIIRRIEADEGPLHGSPVAAERRLYRAIERLIRTQRIARTGPQGHAVYAWHPEAIRRRERVSSLKTCRRERQSTSRALAA